MDDLTCELQEKRPDPNWVEVDPNAASRRGILLPPLHQKESHPPSQPEEFRRPTRKRTRTRWQGDDADDEEAASAEGGGDVPIPGPKASPQVGVLQCIFLQTCAGRKIQYR